jgi:hypothetical protein
LQASSTGALLVEERRGSVRPNVLAGALFDRSNPHCRQAESLTYWSVYRNLSGNAVAHRGFASCSSPGHPA